MTKGGHDKIKRAARQRMAVTGENYTTARRRVIEGHTRSCRMPCDEDCGIGPVHCWNWHRPNDKPDWHNPAECDKAVT